MKKFNFRKFDAEPWTPARQALCDFPGLLELIVAALIIILLLAFAGYDQMEDEQKSAEAISNAKYAALLDAAEHEKEMMVLAAVGNEMPERK
ncbi:hypothetical protein [Undibacterium sp. SXout20W]|uniref:hypothetical protein n=1 Tax=Undibacterium sp. SXout20W TaxID=3413051 RepID=UPI003BEF5629